MILLDHLACHLLLQLQRAWTVIFQQNSLICRVGQRSLISFWNDRWLTEGTFASLFPCLYALASIKGATIADHRSKTTSSWDYSFCRPLKDEEINGWMRLSHILNQIVPPPLEDLWMWSHETSRTFTAKSAFIILNTSDPHLTPPFILVYGKEDALRK